MKKVLIVIVVFLGLAGAGIYKLVGTFSRAGERGDAAVAAFHRDYNAQNIAAIHSGATPAFRTAAPLEKFTQFSGMLHQKLGDWKSGDRTGINLKNYNGKKTMELTYNSTFANGSGTEEFVLDYNGAEPLLISYNVKSTALTETAELEAR
jgi:hypothetical protein